MCIIDAWYGLLRGILSAQNISPTMDGTIVSVGVSLVICVVWTLIWPEKNPDTWATYKSIELQDEELIVDHYEEDPAAMDKALKVRLNSPRCLSTLDHMQGNVLCFRNCPVFHGLQGTLVSWTTGEGSSGQLSNLVRCHEGLSTTVRFSTSPDHANLLNPQSCQCRVNIVDFCDNGLLKTAHLSRRSMQAMQSQVMAHFQEG